jgi:hypothetical protein
LYSSSNLLATSKGELNQFPFFYLLQNLVSAAADSNLLATSKGELNQFPFFIYCKTLYPPRRIQIPAMKSLKVYFMVLPVIRSFSEGGAISKGIFK